ncbi:hypothetical protein Tco_0603708 [Tanacetum coccineum]
MSGSPLNLAEDDHSLRNLKFVSKGGNGMKYWIVNPKSDHGQYQRMHSYYNAYLKRLQSYDQNFAAEEGERKSHNETLKAAQEKPSKGLPATKVSKGKVVGFYKELEVEFLGSSVKLMGLQLFQLELRFGKTPSRSFRPIKSAEIFMAFGHSCSLGFTCS